MVGRRGMTWPDSCELVWSVTDYCHRNSASRMPARMACSRLPSRPRKIQPKGAGTGPTISRVRFTGKSLLKTARPAA